ncbi:MAG: thiamine pyrophosphate-dependent enzyme [Patescibacteria group bacterium]|nr:thiamine pyrophosphate-dependent enzyme [Patescibacteria group bacterium]
MTNLQDLSTGCNPTWCPGCGNFGIWAAFKNAAAAKGWDNNNSVLVAGIGCHGNILNFIKLTSVEGLHGRAIPVATGLKLANHQLNVFVFTGDGDCLGEGGNHLIHACRRNHNLTIFIHDNAVYGLTTGQTSPASPQGYKSKSTPQGNLDHPFSPLALAIASGATFVARGLATDIPKLTELIIKANEHQGLAIVNILQPCITWNKDYTPVFYRDNTYYLDESHDKTNREQAFTKAIEWALPDGRQGEKQVPLGIFYQVDKPSYETTVPQITEKPLIENSSDRDLSDLFQKYT